MSRIDQFYVNDMFGNNGKSIGIVARTCLSDHYPVMLVSNSETHRRAVSIRIPESVQTDGEIALQKKQAWQSLD